MPSLFHLSSTQRSLVVFALIFVVHGISVLTAGECMSPDSWGYSSSADRLIACHFSVVEYLKPVNSLGLAVCYLGFVTLVAAYKTLCHAHWADAVVLTNLAAESLVGVLLFNLVLDTTHRRRTALAALVLYLICFELFLWTRYVLSDTTFLLLTFSMFIVIARSLSAGGPCRHFSFWIGGMLLLALLYRPSALAIALPVAAGWAFTLRQRQVEASLNRKPWLPICWLAIFTLAALVLIVAASFLFQDPHRWPFKAFSGAVTYEAQHYALGEVVEGRPETFHSPPGSLLQHVILGADRVLHFFYFISHAFSGKHNVVNAIFFVPTYLLSAASLWQIFRPASPLTIRTRCVGLLCVFWIMGYSIFHGLMLLDYDWRYRLPMLPLLIFLASLALPRGIDPQPPSNPTELVTG